MPSDRPPLTQDRLKELLHYDPDTGHFTRLVARNRGNAAAGARAGSVARNGYLKIMVDFRHYMAHRLAFLYMTGELPPHCVDHINRDRSDNRWANLRPATVRENGANRGLNHNNTSGHRGVCWSARMRKWRAQGKLEGRVVHLGYYALLDDAAAVALKWREENFGVFAAAGQPTPEPVASQA